MRGSSITRCWRPGREARRPRGAADGLRLALPRRYFCDLLDDDVRARFEDAIDRLRAAGAQSTKWISARRRCASDLPAHLARRRGRVSRGDARHDARALHAERSGCGWRWDGTCSAEDYARALAGRAVLRARGRRGARRTRRPAPADAADSGAADWRSHRSGGRGEQNRCGTLMLRLTQLFNITGHPAIALPCGQTPVGPSLLLQLVGARGTGATREHRSRPPCFDALVLHANSRLEVLDASRRSG